MAKVGFIGLGLMGQIMSRRLVDAGHEVKGFDLSNQAMQAFAEFGGKPGANAQEAAQDCEFVITMLPNGPDVENLLFGESAVAGVLAENAIFIDMSTIGPDATDRIAKKLQAMGRAMIDAPVGGTSDFAAKGQLLILAGGASEDVARASVVFDVLGRETIHCGGNGTGTRTKIVNNYLSTALNALTAEALAFAEAAGLDVMRTVKIMGGTTAGKGFLNGAYDRKIFKGDISPEFGLALASKDLNLAISYAAGLNMPLGVGAAAAQVYSMAKAEGFGGKDWSAILETLRRRAALQAKDYD